MVIYSSPMSQSYPYHARACLECKIFILYPFPTCYRSNNFEVAFLYFFSWYFFWLKLVNLHFLSGQVFWIVDQTWNFSISFLGIFLNLKNVFFFLDKAAPRKTFSWPTFLSFVKKKNLTRKHTYTINSWAHWIPLSISSPNFKFMLMGLVKRKKNKRASKRSTHSYFVPFSLLALFLCSW